MNNINGNGTYTWSDKSQLIGYWKNNELIGDKIFIWPSGKKFLGKSLAKGSGLFEWYLMKFNKRDFGIKYKFDWVNGTPNHKKGEFFNPETKLWTKVGEISIEEKNKENLANLESTIQEKDNLPKPLLKMFPYTSQNSINANNSKISFKNKFNEGFLQNLLSKKFIDK